MKNHYYSGRFHLSRLGISLTWRENVIWWAKDSLVLKVVSQTGHSLTKTYNMKKHTYKYHLSDYKNKENITMLENKFN